MTNKKTGYSPFNEWRWKSYDGRKTVCLNDFLSENKDTMFFIGTDSQNYNKDKECKFTTAIISYRMHKGGRIILHKDKTVLIESLRQRLLEEAMRSLETAWYLNTIVPSESIIGIHLDVNPSLQYKSGKYKDELVGLIMAQGFKALVKPDAWAASSVADTHC